MSPFALFMLVGTLVCWAECVVWFFRRRAHDQRAAPLALGAMVSLVVILGFIAPYIAGIRFLVWSICNGWEWVAGPVSMHARGRWARRRQIRRARRSQVGAAVLQTLPPGQPVLQLAAAHLTQPVHALGAGELVSAPDGTVTMVTRMSDGSAHVMPLLEGRAS